MSKVDIVLVNWNSGDYLRDCLKILSATQWNRSHSKVFIVDNASRDDSMQRLDTGGLDVEYINNKENQGFGAACNQAARQGQSPYILFLNLDVEVVENTISESLNFMEYHADVTVMGCRHTDALGQTQVSCSRRFILGRALNEISGLSYFFPRHFKHATLMKDWDHKGSRDVDNVMGAYYLIRRDAFEKARGFDERFFVYLEDVDLSLRIMQNGGRVYYNSDISIIHHGQGTTSSVVGYRLYLGNQSRLAYAKKHWSIPGFILYLISLFTIGFLVRIFRSLIKWDIVEIKSVFETYAYHLGMKKKL